MLSLFKASPEATAKTQFEHEKADFIKRFRVEMVMLDLVNKLNKTYYLDILNKTNYGFYAHLYLVPGLSFSDLNAKLGNLQENLQIIWIMKTKKLAKYAEVKIVTKPMDNDLPYRRPDDMKPWELYMGLDFSLKIIKNNNNKNCMFLLGGCTGSGKTRYLYMVLLSWILSCQVNEIELYIADIAKDEFINMKYVKHVRYYASELEELYMMMMHIKDKLEKRKQTIAKVREAGTATNIEEYNVISPKKLSYCYVFIDEALSVFPHKSDSKEEQSMKEAIIDALKTISQKGRSLGIFSLLSTQKASKEEMSAPFIKNQAQVRVGFRSNDRATSEVLLGDTSCVGLDDRYGVYSLNGTDSKDYLFSPKLTTEMLNKFLEPHIDKTRKKLDLSYYLNGFKPQEENDKKKQKRCSQSIAAASTRTLKPKAHHYDLIDTSKPNKGVEFIDR